jgi:hypothetical protein
MNARASGNYLAISRLGKETLKFGSVFGSLPDFPSLSPLNQEREKSTRPVFTMCGEPWALKKSRPQYISAHKISTLFDALDERERIKY